MESDGTTQHLNGDGTPLHDNKTKAAETMNDDASNQPKDIGSLAHKDALNAQINLPTLSKMSSKQIAVLAVLMLVSQAMSVYPPPEADECNPADDKTCLEGFVCVNIPSCHSDPPRDPICHPHNKCVPKEQEPLNHIG